MPSDRETKRWSTRAKSGTTVVSSALFANVRLVANHSSSQTRQTSTASDASKRNSQPNAPNARRSSQLEGSHLKTRTALALPVFRVCHLQNLDGRQGFHHRR